MGSSVCRQRRSTYSAPGASRLQPYFGRKAIKYVPRRVDPYDTSVIEFLTDVRIALAIDLVAGKSAHMRPQRTPVQIILLVLDLDVLLPGFDDGSICIRAREAIVQIRMIRLIL